MIFFDSPFFLKNEKAEKEPSSLRKESSSTSSSSLSHLEPNCKKNMNLDEAKLLTMDAVLSGIENDLASGGGIDSCIITANGMGLVVAPAAKSSKKLGTYTFPVGTTPILGETIVRELDPDEIMSTFGSC